MKVLRDGREHGRRPAAALPLSVGHVGSLVDGGLREGGLGPRRLGELVADRRRELPPPRLADGERDALPRHFDAVAAATGEALPLEALIHSFTHSPTT